MFEIFIVDNKYSENVRLDMYISKLKPDLSRTLIQKLIALGKITVNKEIIKSGYKIKFLDSISLEIPEPVSMNVEPENIPLEIVYEDENLIVINKPAGLVVHPAHGSYKGTLVNALLYHCKNLSGINGVFRPGIVHRLDKNTSGLIVAAKNDFTHQKLQNKWTKHEINRKYIALVHGKFAESRFVVKAPIGRDPYDRQKMAVISKNSRSAITHFEVIEEYKAHSLVHAKLDTGRTHQVRVHLAFIKHPVVGDSVYGGGKNTEIISRQALHSALLGFEHPVSKKYMEFESSLPQDMKEAIKIAKGR